MNPVQEALTNLHHFVDKIVDHNGKVICHTELDKLEALFTWYGVKDANPGVDWSRAKPGRPQTTLIAIKLEARNAEVISRRTGASVDHLEELYVNRGIGYIVYDTKLGNVDAWKDAEFLKRYYELEEDIRTKFVAVIPRSHDPKTCGGPGICLPCSSEAPVTVMDTAIAPFSMVETGDNAAFGGLLVTNNVKVVNLTETGFYQFEFIKEGRMFKVQSKNVKNMTVNEQEQLEGRLRDLGVRLKYPIDKE